MIETINNAHPLCAIEGRPFIYEGQVENPGQLVEWFSFWVPPLRKLNIDYRDGQRLVICDLRVIYIPTEEEAKRGAKRRVVSSDEGPL